MADFSKLNGYDVKDAKARADILTLQGKVKINYVRKETTGEQLKTYLKEYQENGTPVIYVDDDGEHCGLVGINGVGATLSSFFLKSSSRLMYEVSGSGNIQITVGEVSKAEATFLTTESTTFECADAVSNHEAYGTPIVWVEDGCKCAHLGNDAYGEMPTIYFFKAPTNEIVMVTFLETVEVTYISIDKSINVEYDAETESLTISE